MSENQPDDRRLPTGSAQGIALTLIRLRTAARAQLVVQRMGLLLAAFIAYVLFAGTIDYFLRMPMPVRLILWMGSLAGLIYIIRRFLVPAVLFNPPLTQVALRVEQSPQGQQAGLSGVLASALELSEGDPGTALSAELRVMTADQARRRFTSAMSTSALLAKRRLGQALGSLLVVAIPLAFVVLTIPTLARIGTARVLTPWSSAAWPKRTGVIDANPVAAHAAGAPLSLRAVLTQTSKSQGQTNITVVYRVIVDGKPGITQRALLTSQNKTLRYEPPSAGSSVEGELFERLLDTTAMAPAHAVGTAAPSVELQYHYETSDDETETNTIALVEPPSIVAASVDVTPPAYAAAALAAQPPSPTSLFKGSKDVGPGRDERASVGPILAGSRINLHLTLNKPLPTPDLPSSLPGLDQAAALSTTLNPMSWDISFTAGQTLRLPVVLTDSYGIAATEDSAYKFDVIEDRPPAAVVIEPPQDEAILPTALIDAIGEGRDDVGLAGVTLLSQAAKPPAGSVGAPPEGQGDPAELAAASNPAAPTTMLRASGTLDVSTLNVVPGDEVWLHARASDIFAFEGQQHPPLLSTRRRLKIIGESELIEQFRAELSGVREAAKRVEQDQDRLGSQRTEAAKDSQKAGEQAQRQEALGERMNPMADAVKRLSGRAERNRLADRSLEGLLKDAQNLIKQAEEKSDQAADALNKLSANTPSQDREQDKKQLEAAQKGVQEDMSQLANMLDRGQDTWAMRRAIEKVLAEQKQITSQTAATDAEQKGQSPDDLNQNQRDELERLAQRQQETAQRTAALADNLEQRAEQMKKTDPTQAQSMQNAANKARQQQADTKQRQAAEQIQQNKTDEAQKNQEAAEQALQSMLDELSKGDQQRDTALRRVLADLIESLEKLIKQQQTELDRLAKVLTDNADATGLDAGMISVNQNTIAVLAPIKAVREAAPVAALIDSAANAQTAAVISLRALDAPEADSNEHISLSRLKDAKAAAEKLDEEAADREAQRKKDELKKIYKEALELEVALRADTLPVLGKDLDRRERQALRALAERQEFIRQSLSEIRSKTQEIEEAKVFDYAHARIDAAAARVIKSLTEGSNPPTVGLDETSIVRTLQALLDAVNEMDKKKDDFREDQDQGGGEGQGGGGEQPLLPPIAELKLLKVMQQEAADLTRHAADASSDESLDRATSLQKDLAEQANSLMKRMQEPPAGPPDQPKGEPGLKPDVIKPDVKPEIEPAKPTTPEPEPHP